MSTVTLCDGCMNPVQEPVKIGHVLRMEYCAGCAVTAQAFVDAEEELRRVAVEAFQKGRAGLIEQYAVNEFKLPDVPL